MHNDLTILGTPVRAPLRKLETFPAPDGIGVVSFFTNEFTSLCPMTGQPDFSDVTIAYMPRDRCLESKSLKLYLWSFREEGHFVEQLAVLLRDALAAALDPYSLDVTVVQKVRGGIITTATSPYRGTLA